MPSGFGVAYLGFNALLFLLGTNYQNNVILLLSYVLASFFIVAMLHSFFNLLGLKIQVTSEGVGEAQKSLGINAELTSQSERFDFWLTVAKQPTLNLPAIKKGANGCQLLLNFQDRGVYRLGRLKVASYYGFGLFTTWSRLGIDTLMFVYPKPLSFDINRMKHLHDDKSSDENSAQIFQNNSLLQGNQDFYELRQYRDGEPLSHVAWKQVAKGQGWLTKQYQQDLDTAQSLALDKMPANNIEDKLSQLVFVLFEYQRIGQGFSLQLGEFNLSQGVGEQHLHQCLKAVAKYPHRSYHQDTNSYDK